jgi:hypothetical protein
MLKTIAILQGFTKDDIFTAMTNISIRKKWDRVFDKFEIIDKDPETGTEYLYMSIKVVFIFNLSLLLYLLRTETSYRLVKFGMNFQIRIV